MSKPKIVGVVGPTASGKTDFAIDLCLERGGEVVSCDSMQIYRGMDIGTAKPTAAEMRGVPHHMIDVADPSEDFSAARFSAMARSCIDDILSRGRLPVLCGGTGLYFDSVVSGISYAETETDLKLRRGLMSLADEKGAEYVHNLLKQVDPVSAEAIHPNNVRRVVRALEIYRLSGKPKSEVDKEQRGEPMYDAEIYGLLWPREELCERINKRVDIMIERGLMDEVKNLLDSGVGMDSTAMQAIGYKEAAEYLRGGCALSEAVEKIKRESRRYAKRQMTWFKRNPNIIWINVAT